MAESQEFRFNIQPPPPPPSTPRKAVRLADGIFTANRNERQRESPDTRRKRPSTSTANLEVTTAATFDPDEEEPIEPLQYQQYQQNDDLVNPPDPPSPTPSGEYDHRSDEDMDQSENGHQNGGAPIVAVDALPTHDYLMTHIPVGRARNRSMQTQPSQPTPADDASGRTPYMRSNGRLIETVITHKRMFANVKPTMKKEVEDSSSHFLAFTVFLGGQRLFATYKNCIDDMYTTLAGIAPPEEMQLYLPDPVDVQSKNFNQKYKDPFTVFAHFNDLGTRTKVYNQRTFARSRELAFTADTIDPTRQTWAVGGWGLRTRIRDVPTMLRYARAALFLHIVTTPEIVRHIGRVRQNVDNTLSPYQHAFEVAKTIDAKWFESPTDPMIACFIEPLNQTFDDDEILKKMIRGVPLSYGMLSFIPKQKLGEMLECVMCRDEDTHLQYLCPFPFPNGVPPPLTAAAGDDWWGPPDQMSKLTEGVLSIDPGRNSNNNAGAGGSNAGGRNNGSDGNRNGGGGGGGRFNPTGNRNNTYGARRNRT
ncbi:hypothetical protein C8R46DRAFT_1137279 [Mycena filopes]|nr:hypothetical protein C8R46DRAFT_1137279 [Mycena filopes]